MSTWGKITERSIGAFKYILAVGMMVSGVTTAIGPLTPIEGALGWIYNSRITLIVFGIIFFLSGLTLLIGKIKRNKRFVGHGIMAIYLCFLFAAILNALAYGGDPSAWVYNFIMALLCGALWLRWKFKTEYINPNHFRREGFKMRQDNDFI